MPSFFENVGSNVAGMFLAGLRLKTPRVPTRKRLKAVKKKRRDTEPNLYDCNSSSSSAHSSRVNSPSINSPSIGNLSPDSSWPVDNRPESSVSVSSFSDVLVRKAITIC